MPLGPINEACAKQEERLYRISEDPLTQWQATKILGEACRLVEPFLFVVVIRGHDPYPQYFISRVDLKCLGCCPPCNTRSRSSRYTTGPVNFPSLQVLSLQLVEMPPCQISQVLPLTLGFVSSFALVVAVHGLTLMKGQPPVWLCLVHRVGEVQLPNRRVANPRTHQKAYGDLLFTLIIFGFVVCFAQVVRSLFDLACGCAETDPSPQAQANENPQRLADEVRLLHAWVQQLEADGTRLSYGSVATIDPSEPRLVCTFSVPCGGRISDSFMNRAPHNAYKGYPSVFESVGDAEVFRRECEQLVALMRTDGVDVELDMQEDPVHDFLGFTIVPSKKARENVMPFPQNPRAFAVRLLVCYAYAIGESPMNFIAPTTAAETVTLLKGADRRSDVLFGLNDDWNDGEVAAADKVLRDWFRRRLDGSQGTVPIVPFKVAPTCALTRLLLAILPPKLQKGNNLSTPYTHLRRQERRFPIPFDSHPEYRSRVVNFERH
ncbi:hypothetical protein DFH09DRAFT_1086716 [Mycena vulgaris]|nr:hypothetical protein DFH09DRAFT_1086716 [Mycena vulgaris]